MATMTNRESRYWILCFALCALTFGLLAGCQQEQKDEPVILDLPPDPATVSVSSGYAADAIQATGGLDAWKGTREVKLDCVATFYQSDGGHYLTRQSYAVYPWSNSIQITAPEPQGTSVWQLSRGRYDILQGSARIDELSAAMPGRCLAEAILSIVTAPVRMLDSSAEFAGRDSAVKLQGQWYQPVDRQARAGVLATEQPSDAVFYQNRDSSLIDLIHFVCSGTNGLLAVRGYDYAQVEKGGLLVPTKIEIFTADSEQGAKVRLAKIDCHTIVSMK